MTRNAKIDPNPNPTASPNLTQYTLSHTLPEALPSLDQSLFVLVLTVHEIAEMIVCAFWGESRR